MLCPILTCSCSLCIIFNNYFSYWLRGHEGWGNNCFSKIQLAGQKYQDKTNLASKTRFIRHCFSFQSWCFSLLVGYITYSLMIAQPIKMQHWQYNTTWILLNYVTRYLLLTSFSVFFWWCHALPVFCRIVRSLRSQGYFGITANFKPWGAGYESLWDYERKSVIVGRGIPSFAKSSCLRLIRLTLNKIQLFKYLKIYLVEMYGFSGHCPNFYIFLTSKFWRF